MTRTRLYKDWNGKPANAGDTITFCYGIPGRSVVGVLFERNGKLICPSPGHKPEEATLEQIQRHCGGFTILKRAAP